MITLVHGGEVYSPEPVGAASVLALNGTIAQVGDVGSTHDLERFDVPVERLDAVDGLVVPGLIDPHAHLIGGSGEAGFGTWSPELNVSEFFVAGVTTVVGCLGVDTTMKSMATLVGKAKGLRTEGLTAYVYSGGYNVPPSTLFGSVRQDMLFVDEVIGAGETAIADRRGSQPAASELARLVSDAYVGGLLSGKAGVTHFHVGDGPARLASLRTLLDDYDIAPRSLYPSHVERNAPLLLEAAALTHRGVCVDMDTVGDDLPDSLAAFVRAGGDVSRLTVSSDAAISGPVQRLDQLRACVHARRWPLEMLLSLITVNVARALSLDRKGRIAPGMDADIVVLERDSLQVRHVITAGQVVVRDGKVERGERFLRHGRRRITLHGQDSHS